MAATVGSKIALATWTAVQWANAGHSRAFYGHKIPFISSEKLLSYKAASGAPEDITAAAGFTDCRARELSEVLHFGALSRALDAQPANHEYTSYADGPVSPSHSMHSLDGPVKLSLIHI